MQALAALEALAQCDRELRPRDIGMTGDAASESEALVQRLEAIREVALELLGAAQVLDASRAPLRGGSEAAAQGHEPGPVARQVGVEGVAMQVDRAPGHEPVVERDRPAVEAQREHCEAALVGELRERRPLEALALGQAEGRAVGPPLPAHVVQREGVGQVSQHRLAGRRERRLEAAELAQLALAAAILVAAVRARVALVGLVPAVGHVGHGRLDPLHHAHAASRRPRASTLSPGRPKTSSACMLESRSAASSLRAVSGGSPGASTMSPSADSCAPANIATRVRPAWRRANGAKPTSSPARSATTTYGSLAKAGSANQARTQAEKQVRARARHGLDQRVPRGIELSEAINVGQRAHPRAPWQ